MKVLAPPSSCALTKSPSAGRKTSSMPPYRPARVAGSVTREEGAHRAVVEVLAGLDQRDVHPLERGVDRQDHEHHEAVDQAADTAHGVLRKVMPSLSPDPRRPLLTRPSSESSAFQAYMRIR